MKMKEFVKSLWFSKYLPPNRPGVYLTRSGYSWNKKPTWWRAFDGWRWHAGVMAEGVSGTQWPSPSYRELVNNSVIGEHIHIEWCGRSK
jgi:hypothetical protein